MSWMRRRTATWSISRAPRRLTTLAAAGERRGVSKAMTLVESGDRADHRRAGQQGQLRRKNSPVPTSKVWKGRPRCWAATSSCCASTSAADAGCEAIVSTAGRSRRLADRRAPGCRAGTLRELKLGQSSSRPERVSCASASTASIGQGPIGCLEVRLQYPGSRPVRRVRRESSGLLRSPGSGACFIVGMSSCSGADHVEAGNVGSIGPSPSCGHRGRIAAWEDDVSHCSTKRRGGVAAQPSNDAISRDARLHPLPVLSIAGVVPDRSSLPDR